MRFSTFFYFILFSYLFFRPDLLTFRDAQSCVMARYVMLQQSEEYIEQYVSEVRIYIFI